MQFTRCMNIEYWKLYPDDKRTDKNSKFKATEKKIVVWMFSIDIEFKGTAILGV